MFYMLWFLCGLFFYSFHIKVCTDTMMTESWVVMLTTSIYISSIQACNYLTASVDSVYRNGECFQANLFLLSSRCFKIPAASYLSDTNKPIWMIAEDMEDNKVRC